MRVGSPVPGPPLISPAAGIGVYGGVELAGRTEATSKLSGVGVWAWQSPTTITAAKVINQNRVAIITGISVLALITSPVYAQTPSFDPLKGAVSFRAGTQPDPSSNNPAAGRAVVNERPPYRRMSLADLPGPRAGPAADRGLGSVICEYRLSPARFSAAGNGQPRVTPMRLNYVRKKYVGEPARRVLDCPAINRIPAAGQHQGSTSAIRTATSALVAN